VQNYARRFIHKGAKAILGLTGKKTNKAKPKATINTMLAVNNTSPFKNGSQQKLWLIASKKDNRRAMAPDSQKPYWFFVVSNQP